MNNIEQHWPVLLQQYTMAKEFSDNRVKKQQINSQEGCDFWCSRSMALGPQAGSAE